MKSIGNLLNQVFWKKIFYALIYIKFNEELFDSTDETNFQTICNL